MALVSLPQKPVDEEEVAALAYRLWEQRNRHEGAAAEDWLVAERLLHNRNEQEVSNQAA